MKEPYLKYKTGCLLIWIFLALTSQALPQQGRDDFEDRVQPEIETPAQGNDDLEDPEDVREPYNPRDRRPVPDSDGLPDKVQARLYLDQACTNLYAAGTLVADLKTGPWIYYYPDGKTKAQGDYALGKKHGQWKNFDQQGNIVRVDNYRYGELVKSTRIE